MNIDQLIGMKNLIIDLQIDVLLLKSIYIVEALKKKTFCNSI